MPAVQTVPVTDMEEGVRRVIGDDVPFASFGVEREHDEMDVVAEQAVAQFAVKRNDSGVIQRRVFLGALLEINGKSVKRRALSSF